MSVDWQYLHRKWVHAHEEDTKDCLVFRPEEYPLGLSRGRDAIQFFEDGSVARTGIAPNDTLTFSNGNWTLLDDGETLNVSETHRRTAVKVVSLDPDKLVISK
jgi:hypothetical protein